MVVNKSQARRRSITNPSGINIRRQNLTFIGFRRLKSEEKTYDIIVIFSPVESGTDFRCQRRPKACVFNHLSPHDALKHDAFYILDNRLYFPRTKGFRSKISMKLVY